MRANSFSDCENATNFGDVFTVFEPVCKNPKGKRLGSRDGFVTSDAVGQNTRKSGYLTDPPTVLFALDLDVELAHAGILLLAAIRCRNGLTVPSSPAWPRTR